MRWIEAGTEPVAVFAFGLAPVGIVAIGSAPTGVIAVGQLARGVVSVGQLSVGGFAFGQLSVGIGWAGGQLAIAATSGFAMLPIGLAGRWIPFRESFQPRTNWYRSPWRLLMLAIVFAVVIAVSIEPLLDAIVREDGIFRQPAEPRVLR